MLVSREPWWELTVAPMHRIHRMLRVSIQLYEGHYPSFGFNDFWPTTLRVESAKTSNMFASNGLFIAWSAFSELVNSSTESFTMQGSEPRPSSGTGCTASPEGDGVKRLYYPGIFDAACDVHHYYDERAKKGDEGPRCRLGEAERWYTC